MKITHVLVLLITFFLSTSAALGQLTSISQFRDVKETDEFYEDLQSLVERYGVVSPDTKTAKDDLLPGGKSKNTTYLFSPNSPIPNRDIAVLLNSSLDRMTELMSAESAGQELTTEQKQDLETNLVSLYKSSPIYGDQSLVSIQGVKGTKEGNPEFYAIQSLIERYGVGADLVNTGKIFDPAKTYSEKQISGILSNVLGIEPECVSTECYIGNLALNFQNKMVTRARFARILNQYLSDFREKMDEAIEKFNKNLKKTDDEKLSDLALAVDIIKILCALPINFKSGTDQILPESIPNLEKQAKFLLSLPTTTVVEVGVHSDNVGSEAINLKITQSRANAVRDALIKLGVQGKNLTALGYGSSKPLALNTTAEGRAKNRRVLFMIVKM